MDIPPTAAQATPVGSAKVLDMTNVSTNGSGRDGQDALQKEMLAIAQERRELIKSGAVKGYTYVDQQEAQLNTGHRIPVVGLGTWKAAKGEVHAAVVTALKAGYRHIDCAAVYGNEHEVGAAFHEVFQEGHLGREEVFVTSKLWNTEHAPSRVEAACRKTLSDLQLSQLDLYLIHWPSSLVPGPEVSPPLIDTWRAMEQLVDKGLVRSIGVSNFSSKKMEALIAEARIKPAVLQVEAHTYFRNTALLQWCQAHGIHFTAYSPLGSPDSASIMGRGADTPSPMKDPVVVQVAERLGRSPAQVMLRWGVQRGTSVLPKSVNPGRIAANLDLFSWSLSEADMQALEAIPTQIRMVAGTFLTHASGPYKTLQDLWDE
ncbi:low CO2-induced aldose reductase [Haematococcus lacustris]